MVFVWRGVGLVVPIILFITGWIVSFWYKGDETKLGDSGFVGWTSIYSSIVILVIGLGVFGERQENKKKGIVTDYPHFFFIPIIVWGAILLAFGIFMLVS